MGLEKTLAPFEQTCSLESLATYQLSALNNQLAYVQSHSSWYKTKFSSILLPLSDLSAIQQLPCTTAADICNDGSALICVPGTEITRIVSLLTSGSVQRKRMYFTQNDLSHTVSFFEKGMQYMISESDKIAICMPGNSPNGISDLLFQSLQNINCVPLHIGCIDHFFNVIQTLRIFHPHCIVGIPSQIRKLALLAPDLRPRAVLLSSDYLPLSTSNLLKNIWNCNVFNHYGLTESGYGFAVECNAHQGLHIRHDALFVEIINPLTTQPVSPGQWGEVVFTSLLTHALPLIRYRTGDIGRLLTEPCACGSTLPRLDFLKGRYSNLTALPSIYDLDELLFADATILDYQVYTDKNKFTLKIQHTDLCSFHHLSEILSTTFPACEFQLLHCDEVVYQGKRTLLQPSDLSTL